MNPLSSYAAMGGDSGCKYIIGEDYFATINRNDGSFVSVTNPNMDIATSGLDGLQNMIEVSNWEWKEFPYTDEEWAALYTPQGFGGISNISEIYDEMLYQPLTAGKFLLKMDNSLWLVELAANQQMGTYLWSIYSLVPESAMGVAQWEYAPMLSSRSPYFRVEFDMDYTEISAVCTQSLLVDRDASGTPSDTSLIIKDGNALYWSPIDKDGNVVTAAIIHFSVHQGDIAPYSGTIYIEGNSGSDGRRIYNATIVGTGLHLEPHSEISGGVVSAIEDSEECVNDTWLNAWNAMPPQKPTKLQMFLAKITRNISFNRFNARSAEKRGGGEIVLVLDELAECLAGESDVESEYEARELGQCIRMFVRALPERDGNVFVRRYFFTEPVAEIAKRYGLTDNNVMVILSRTRKKLKVHLVKEGFFSE